MKKILFLFASFSSIGSYGQEVISSSGTEFINSVAQFSFTLGESVMFTGISTNDALTQGFQQPTLKVTGIDDVSIPGLKIYPNPTFSSINIESPYPTNYQLFDLNGKLVREGVLSEKSTLDLSNVATATYVLSITEGQKTNQYKIIKLN